MNQECQGLELQTWSVGGHNQVWIVVLLLFPKCSARVGSGKSAVSHVGMTMCFHICLTAIMLFLTPAWSWRRRTMAGFYLSAWNERNHLLLDMIKFGSSSLGKIPPMDADFPGFG